MGSTPDGSIRLFIERIESLMRGRAPSAEERALSRSHKMRERMASRILCEYETPGPAGGRSSEDAIWGSVREPQIA